MPCNSSYMEPLDFERRLQQTAQLLMYVLEKLHRVVPKEVLLAAQDPYCKQDFVADLCGVISRMSKSQLERIVYNGRDSTARKLADWWDEHLMADAGRQALENEEMRRERIIRTAYDKLNDEERDALCLPVSADRFLLASKS